MFVCVMVFEADVMLVCFWADGVQRCWLRESFPGERILCEATVCLLERVSGAVIDQLLLDFVFVIVKLAITISCDVI